MEPLNLRSLSFKRVLQITIHLNQRHQKDTVHRRQLYPTCLDEIPSIYVLASLKHQLPFEAEWILLAATPALGFFQLDDVLLLAPPRSRRIWIQIIQYDSICKESSSHNFIKLIHVFFSSVSLTFLVLCHPFRRLHRGQLSKGWLDPAASGALQAESARDQRSWSLGPNNCRRVEMFRPLFPDKFTLKEDAIKSKCLK